jgi:hypothetical protein
MTTEVLIKLTRAHTTPLKFNACLPFDWKNNMQAFDAKSWVGALL